MDPIDLQTSELPQSEKGEIILEGVKNGARTSPQERAIAWRLAESKGMDNVIGEGMDDVISKIKRDIDSKTESKDIEQIDAGITERFDLADEFLTTTIGYEDALSGEGIKLKPVSDDTKKYMLEGLELGIERLDEEKYPELLFGRLSTIKGIMTRAIDKDTYLDENQIRKLYLTVMVRKLFKIDRLINEKGKNVSNVYTDIRKTLNEMVMVTRKIYGEE